MSSNSSSPPRGWDFACSMGETRDACAQIHSSRQNLAGRPMRPLTGRSWKSAWSQRRRPVLADAVRAALTSGTDFDLVVQAVGRTG